MRRVALVAFEGIGDLGDRTPAERAVPLDQPRILVDADPELALGQRVVAVVDEDEHGGAAPAGDALPHVVAHHELAQRALVA